MKKVSILGSTGSIGRSTLAVVDRYPERLRVQALACGNNQQLLAQQVIRYQPAFAAIGNGEPGDELRDAARSCGCELLSGTAGLETAASAPGADVVVAALLGAAGLTPTLAAIAAGRTIALANKEVMVMAGKLVLQMAKKHGATILPVDSEHNAIFQCLAGTRREALQRVLLCASGGPFLHRSERFDAITVEEALAHPRWKMGAKISVDSATLMNKGLEMIEALWLFDLLPEQISVIIHPQSIVHSMVEFCDGSIIAQMSRTDMVMPIQYCLSYPERWENLAMRLDLPEVGRLEFAEPDRARFHSLDLAEQTIRSGGTLPAVFNAADEVAVAAFLNGTLTFPSIMAVVEETMQRHKVGSGDTIEEIFEADAWARKTAGEVIGRRRRN